MAYNMNYLCNTIMQNMVQIMIKLLICRHYYIIIIIIIDFFLS